MSDWPKMADFLAEGNLIDFGEVPDAVNAQLQEGVAAYYDDRPAAEAIFRRALDMAPQVLPIYFCLYMIHTYQGQLDQALAAATAGLKEAARQGGLEGDWRDWAGVKPEGAQLFALYTLKATAFIHLRRGERDQAVELLDKLARLDPMDNVGHSVVMDIARRLA